MFTKPTIVSRIKEAAIVIQPFLKNNLDELVDAEATITSALHDVGVIDDSDLSIKILESNVNVAELDVALKSKGHSVPGPRVKVATLILQGRDPFKQTEVPIDDLQITNMSDSYTTTNDAVTLKMLLSSIQQNKPIGQWSDFELLAKYNKDCSSEVECELLKRSKGRPVIIFKDNDTVDIDMSLILLRQARHREMPNTYAVDSSIKPVYKVGDYPMNVLYECPVHSNILLVDGYCEECGLKWLDFDTNKDKYIFLRLISESHKIEPSNLRSYLQQSFDNLVALYPKLYLTYTELKEEDKLPTLKRRLSKTKNGDPFRVVHTQY